MNKFSSFALTIAAAISIATPLVPGSAAAAGAEPEQPPTLVYWHDGYHPAKLEPLNGTYLGAYVEQDGNIKADQAAFNAITGKKHATFFCYVGYGQPFPSAWVKKIKEQGAFPQIALEPNDGLDVVQEDKYLHDFAKAAKESGVPIYLRFASEMNGTWTAYSGDPAAYIAKWRMVYKVMKEEAPNVAMVWTVFTFPESTITSFYPGDDYVDWVGLNIYNVVYHNNDPQLRADDEDPLRLLDYVYNTYAYKKPIQISEFGATHYAATDGKEYVDFAKRSIARMYSHLLDDYPRVKSIYYFDVNNLTEYQENRKINNYSVTDNPDVLKAYADNIRDPRFLSDLQEPASPTGAEGVRERMTYRDFLFQQGGNAYADVAFYQNNLGISVTIAGKRAKLSRGSVSVTAPVVAKAIPKGYGGEDRTIRGIPVRQTLEALGYRVDFDPAANAILIDS